VLEVVREAKGLDILLEARGHGLLVPPEAVAGELGGDALEKRADVAELWVGLVCGALSECAGSVGERESATRRWRRKITFLEVLVMSRLACGGSRKAVKWGSGPYPP